MIVHLELVFQVFPEKDSRNDLPQGQKMKRELIFQVLLIMTMITIVIINDRYN